MSLHCMNLLDWLRPLVTVAETKYSWLEAMMVESLLLYMTGSHSLASILESSRTLRSVIISGFLRKTRERFIIKNL